MGAKPVVIVNPLTDDVSQVTFTEHDEMIQAFVLNTLNPGFGERI